MANETKKADVEVKEEAKVDKATEAKKAELEAKKAEIEKKFEETAAKAQQFQQDLTYLKRYLDTQTALQNAVNEMEGMKKEYALVTGELAKLN